MERAKTADASTPTTTNIGCGNLAYHNNPDATTYTVVVILTRTRVVPSTMIFHVMIPRIYKENNDATNKMRHMRRLNH